MSDGTEDPGAWSRRQMWDELKRRGVAKVEVSFHGGNDEGGVDAIQLFSASGELLETLNEYNETVFDSVQRRHVKIEKDETHLLTDALVKPVYDEYYSFAGDYHVEGTVTFDVATEKVRMSGTETVPSDVHIDREV